MNDITLEEAVELVREANTLSREELAGKQQERLRDIVAHAREHSAFYAEKYADLSEDPSLDELPVVTKQELTARLQDWICDQEFSETELVDFIHDSSKFGKLFKEKYSVSTTSGTTGEPLRMMRDSRHVNINAAILQVRLYNSPLLKGAPNLAGENVKCASVLASGGHHAAFTAFKKRQRALEASGITGTMELLSIGEPVEEMVRRLNDFQPEIITGYPSFLNILSGEQHEGRLAINPGVILCSAEQLTDVTRKRIEERFHCPVGNVFCSTEGGEVALLCDHGRMHLNTDWILVEPVDKAGNPVKPGTMSEAILVTNLMNAVQPIIRYMVDDCVILHEEPCGCGLPFPYVDVLGRTDDIPAFDSGGNTVRLSPLAFVDAVCDIEGISIFQFIQPAPRELVMRVQYLEATDQEAARSAIVKSVTDNLANHGLSGIVFSVVEKEPRRAKKGKKMKTYVKDF